jgi:glutathione synthase/RimK-type ligase-like ATP-grasp enzyme
VVARLAAAGLPVPPTYVTAATEGGWERPSGVNGAWVTKPVRGVHGWGVAMHAAFPTAIAPVGGDGAGALVGDDGTRLVQRRIGGDQADLKVYVADGRCFAGAKRFAEGSYATDRIAPVALDDATTELVHAAGAALGLSCFGVDLRSGEDGSAIVDVNPFPGYRGFPDAVPALRAEIERALAGAGS